MAPKVFIVTGASKGIGAAVARRLLSLSHNVVLTARSEDLLEAVKKSHPSQVEYIAGDITNMHVCRSPASEENMRYELRTGTRLRLRLTFKNSYPLDSSS